MTKQTSSALLLIAAVAGSAGFVALVALLIVRDFTVSPAGFLALLVALATMIVLFQGLHRASDPKDRPDRAPRSDGGPFNDRTVRPATAAVAPGSAGGETGSADRSLDRSAGTATFSDAKREKPSVVTVASEPESAGRRTGAAPSEADDVDAVGRADPGAGETPIQPAEADEPEMHRGDPAEAGLAAAEGFARPETQAATSPPETSTEAEAGAPKVRSGTLLKGEEDLAARKGIWRYERGARSDEAEDGGTRFAERGESVIGVEPVRLDEAREGGPDDLKRIKGVGPTLEEMLHRLGVYHYDQIAAWNEKEVLWVDEHLDGFKGRVSRDEWVAQARRMAAGEDLEPSSDGTEHDGATP